MTRRQMVKQTVQTTLQKSCKMQPRPTKRPSTATHAVSIVHDRDSTIQNQKPRQETRIQQPAMSNTTSVQTVTIKVECPAHIDHQISHAWTSPNTATSLIKTLHGQTPRHCSSSKVSKTSTQIGMKFQVMSAPELEKNVS